MTDWIITGLVIAVVIAFVRIFSQNSQILRLEKKLNNLQKQLAAVMASEYLAKNPTPNLPTSSQSAQTLATSQAAPILTTPPPASISVSESLPIETPSTTPNVVTSSQLRTPVTQDDSAPRVVTSLFYSLKGWFLGENLVVRVGALVLLVGVVLLLKLASQYIQVSMPVRMAMVAMGGLLLTGVGYKTTAKRRGYGLTLQGAGFAVIYLTVFASFKLYGLLPPTLTFVMLAVLAMFTVMFSVWQNALVLAVLAFGGAFFAPILVSRPDGSVVMLFGYYLLLNVAVAVIAHYRTWKLLNALSLVTTFGLAYVWGFGQFQQLQGEGEGVPVWAAMRWQLIGLLVAHMALYLFIAVRYSQQVVRYNQQASMTKPHVGGWQAYSPILSIDAGLLFGTALMGFGLMASLLNDLPYHLAVASSGLSAVYLALGFWLLQQHRNPIRQNLDAREGFDNSFEVLIEASLALGCGFLALVMPLALSGQWLNIGWAVQGSGLVWLGQRTRRRWTGFLGLSLQAASLVLLVAFEAVMRQWYLLLDSLSVPHQALMADFSSTLPAAVLSATVLLSGFVLRHGLPSVRPQTAMIPTPVGKAAMAAFGLSFILSSIGFLLYIAAICSTNTRGVAAASDLSFKLAVGMMVFLLVGQRIETRFGWQALCRLSRLILPFAMLSWAAVCHRYFAVHIDYNADYQVTNFSGLGQYLLGMLGCLAMAKLLGALLLRGWHQQGVAIQVDQVVWLLTLIAMATWLLQAVPFGYWQAGAELSAIVTVLPMVVSVIGLIGLLYLPTTWQRLYQRLVPWLEPTALLRHSGYILMPLTLFWLINANLSLDGQLLGSYVPVLNPLDLTLIAILLYQAYLAIKAHNRIRPWLSLVCALGAFITLSSMMVRSFASLWGTPIWQDGAWQVSEVQTGLTILWTITAMILMFLANKKAMRVVWFAGMALLALVVAKLMMVDMSNTSAVLRVVSFIGAGLLILVIGYLAPLPPRAAHADTKSQD